MNWEPYTLSIETLVKLHNSGGLIIKPKFQRNIVWTEHSMVLFIESLLMNFPVPPIYYQEVLVGDKKILFVIDGQQRLNSILKFCDDDLTLKKLDELNDEGLTFEQLKLDSTRLQNFLNYQIPGVVVKESDESTVGKFYARINRNTVNLNEQEIRRALYPGDFLMMCESLAEITFWKRTSFFTKLQIKRLSNIEFISELMISIISGVQDKKSSISKFYEDNSNMEKTVKKDYMKKFVITIKNIKLLFNGYDLNKSRFKKYSDFYSLFVLFNEFDQEKINLLINKSNLVHKWLKLFEYGIYPQSNINLLSTYGIKCVSQANSSSSRVWRKNFLKDIFEYIVDEAQNETVITLINDINEYYDLEIQLDSIDIEDVYNDIIAMDREDVL